MLNLNHLPPYYGPRMQTRMRERSQKYAWRGTSLDIRTYGRALVLVTTSRGGAPYVPWCRQCSICRLSKPQVVGGACVGGRSLARAWAWAGAATRVSYAFTSLGWRALLYFRLQALRTCDASQVSPRASERSPSRPTGLETNVSASVPAPKKTRVLKHNPYEDDCRNSHDSSSEAWRALRSEPTACFVR